MFRRPWHWYLSFSEVSVEGRANNKKKNLFTRYKWPTARPPLWSKARDGDTFFLFCTENYCCIQISNILNLEKLAAWRPNFRGLLDVCCARLKTQTPLSKCGRLSAECIFSVHENLLSIEICLAFQWMPNLTFNLGYKKTESGSRANSCSF